MEHNPYTHFTNAMDAHARWEKEQEAKEDDTTLSVKQERQQMKREDEEHSNTLLYWDDQLTSFENRIANRDFVYALDLIEEFEERNPGIYEETYKEWGQRLAELKQEALIGKDTMYQE